MHVGGAYGLPAAIGRAGPIRGREQPDSVRVGAHKCLRPKACSVASYEKPKPLGEFVHEQGTCAPAELHARTYPETTRPPEPKLWSPARGTERRSSRPAIRETAAATTATGRSERPTRDLRGSTDLSIVRSGTRFGVGDSRPQPGVAKRSRRRTATWTLPDRGEGRLRPCFANYRTPTRVWHQARRES